ncbi:MAG: bifunctional 4-hydroxy-2-oxoglutarate aldolase/2-dehydro-3-deoxy-phosphogluconate aldolase [candidate division Zixibacteria bacterium]|nr:bifunctional 4-hydroxy-2-oxoglutarate aldolase/2-dehydro-3-deoxy-phosphogluconate aldolase [candidate division Zixibacteria bacterium]
MSSKDESLRFLLEGGVVAVVRADRPDELVRVVQALSEGGIRAIEITLTTPGALDVIRTCAERFRGQALIGAGTILDTETARAAILAGAEYLVAPTLDPAVVKMCRRYSKIAIPGAFTPTEVLAAWECGADLVKVFPATALGPRYFRDLKGPLPQIDLIPTGGVSLENAGEFIRAGASAVAVGGNLIDRAAVTRGDWTVISETAQKYVDAVRQARQEKP